MLDGVDVNDTKTWFPEEAITSVRNCNVYVFEADTKKMAYYSDGYEDHPCSAYFDAEAGQTISPTLKYNHTYDIYFFANVGDLDPETVTDESAMENLQWVLPDWKTRGYSYLRECDSKGKGKHSFPMAKAYVGHNTKTDGLTFTLQRLIGSYKVKKGDIGDGISINIDELKLCNAAVDIHPFRKMDYYSDLLALKNKGRYGYVNRVYASKSENTLPGYWDPAEYGVGDNKIGDMRVEQADLDILNAGGTITLYYLETMNGEANCLSQFYGTQNDTCKCYEYMAEKEEPHFLQTIPYLYYEATKTTVSSTQHTTFRFYTGMNNTCDFSMPRNTETEVQLTFKKLLINEKENDWKVDPNPPTYKKLKWKADMPTEIFYRYSNFYIKMDEWIDTELNPNDYKLSYEVDSKYKNLISVNNDVSGKNLILTFASDKNTDILNYQQKYDQVNRNCTINKSYSDTYNGVLPLIGNSFDLSFDVVITSNDGLVSDKKTIYVKKYCDLTKDIIGVTFNGTSIQFENKTEKFLNKTDITFGTSAIFITREGCYYAGTNYDVLKFYKQTLSGFSLPVGNTKDITLNIKDELYDAGFYPYPPDITLQLYFTKLKALYKCNNRIVQEQSRDIPGYPYMYFTFNMDILSLDKYDKRTFGNVTGASKTYAVTYRDYVNATKDAKLHIHLSDTAVNSNNDSDIVFGTDEHYSSTGVVYNLRMY